MNIVPRSKPFVDVATELLSRGYRVRFRAEGASMHPTIRAGETITVEPRSEIAVGDIAFYRAKRGLIAHRVVEIRQWNGNARLLLTRGEDTGSTDEAVREHQILGRVVAVERNGRSIDLGGRWAKVCGWARRSVRSARRWGRNSGGARDAGVLLLVAALVAMLPITVRASIAITGQTSASFASGNNCTLTGLNTTGANYILFSASGTNASGFNAGSAITLTPAGGTVTLLTSVTTTPSAGIWQITGFTPNASTTITAKNFVSGAAGFVCGAVAFSGVDTTVPATVWTPTGGTSTSPSITGPAPGPGGFVFDTLSVAGGTPTAAAAAGQAQQWSAPSGNGGRVGAASVATPTGTMSWTLSSSQSWQMLAVALGPVSSTQAQPTSLTVTRQADRNRIELKPGRDLSTLGFNVYREQNGRRVRLNSSLLAGTALLAGRETSLTAGHVQTSWDVPSGESSSVSYWLEEVDLHGRHIWRGPVTPKPAASESADSAVSTAFTTVTPWEGRVTLLSRVGREGAASAGVDAAPRAARTAQKQKTKTPQLLKTQYALAAGQAVKLGVQSEGWYRVAWSDLLQAGLDPNADPATLQLFVEGVEQPILVQGQSNIQFYGTGLDTTWSDTRVYWLTWGHAAGRRVQTETPQRKAAAGPPSFPFTVEWKPRTVYFPTLLNGDADNFFGPVLTSGAPVGQSITLTHVDGNAAEAAQLRVALQGVSIAPHNVGVALNGTPVGTVTFSEQKEGAITLTVPATFLQEGQNLLALTVEGGEEDVSVVDAIELSYPRRYIADGDSLRFTAESDQTETIGGFSTSQIQVLDITNPEQVTVVPAKIISQAGTWGVTIVPQGGGTRTLLAFTSAAEASPASITPHHPSSWHAQQAGFDMVMISHANFLPALGSLMTLHQGQGLKVAAIDVEDLYDEFNLGEKSPYALKDFLSTASAQWQRKPRFVLLVGDATLDPRNYLGAGHFDFVPTYLVDTTTLETASDDWFADFSGQAIPQMAIGRFPVRTAQDAATLVSKVVNYEQSGSAAWQQQVLLVAGQNDSENDFQGLTAAVQALLPASMTVSEITEGAGANLDLLNSLNNQGAAVVNYVGHGAQTTWAGGLFSSADASGLTNGAMVPFVVSMTCLNGYFQDVFATSLAKSLIGAPGGGALAVWASSGLTDSASQGALNQGLMKALFGAAPMTIGEAAAAAKKAVGDLDVRRTWILFGDPAVRLHK